MAIEDTDFSAIAELPKLSRNGYVPTLWTGRDLGLIPSERDFRAEWLIEKGITVVIDIRLEEEGDDTALWARKSKKHGKDISYYRFPSDDAHGHHIPATLFYDVAEVMRQHEGENVLIHCHMGVNRGPSVAFYAMLEFTGYTMLSSITRLYAAHPNALVYYAEDAVTAWCDNKNASSGTVPEVIAALRKEMDKYVKGREQHVKGVITRKHKEDRKEMEASDGLFGDF